MIIDGRWNGGDDDLDGIEGGSLGTKERSRTKELLVGVIVSGRVGQRSGGFIVRMRHVWMPLPPRGRSR